MSQLLETQQLLKRIEAYVVVEVNAGKLLPGSFALIKAAWLEGELKRGAAASITGYQTRQARSVLKRLLEIGIFTASSPKGPVKLAFSVAIAEQWFPRLWSDG